VTHERLSRCAKARVLRKWCGEAQREFFGLSFQVRAHTKDPKGHCGHFGSFSCIQHEHESLLAAILIYLSIHQPAAARVSLRDSGEKLRNPQSEAPTGCCGDHRPFHMPVPRIARAPTYQKGSDAYPHRGGRALTRRGDPQQGIRDRAALALCFVQKGLHAGVAALLNQACPCGSSSMRSRPTVSGTRTKKPRGRMKAKTGHG